MGRGTIGITAHLGNYELAGAYFSMSGFPVHAVVLTHQNRWVDRFFNRQRQRVGMRPIPIQQMSRREFLDRVGSVFKKNEMLALLGDRDFFHHGLTLELFGRPIQIPSGPAAFCVRHQAPVVPTFMVREPDGKYRFFIERPLLPAEGLSVKEAQAQVTRECLAVMKRFIERYPTQWYLFQEFWKPPPALVL